MTLMRKLGLLLAASLSVASVGLTANNAHAGGVGGDWIERLCGDCGVGKALDQLNAKDRPFENQVVRPFMNSVVPGSGDAFIMGQRIQDGLNRGAGPAPAPGFSGGGFPGRQMNGGMQPQISYGNFCQTYGGRFGPGPVQPVGTRCESDGPYGYFVGYVTQ